jgi:hypothetical protein
LILSAVGPNRLAVETTETFYFEVAPLGGCSAPDAPNVPLAGAYSFCLYSGYSVGDSTTSSNGTIALTGSAPTFVALDGVIWRPGFHTRVVAPFDSAVGAAEDADGYVLVGGLFGRLALAIPK